MKIALLVDIHSHQIWILYDRPKPKGGEKCEKRLKLNCSWCHARSFSIQIKIDINNLHLSWLTRAANPKYVKRKWVEENMDGVEWSYAYRRIGTNLIRKLKFMFVFSLAFKSLFALVAHCVPTTVFAAETFYLPKFQPWTFSINFKHARSTRNNNVFYSGIYISPQRARFILIMFTFLRV